MATAKEILYHPPLALLPKRKDATIATPSSNHPAHPRGPTLTVTIPFSFSTRLSRLDDRRQRSAASIRRSKPTLKTTTPRTTSLPRLAQPSVETSNTTSRSTATHSGSVAKRTSSEGEASLESGAEEVDVGAHEVEAAEELELLSPEEERERRLNNAKCQKWLEGLPEKFSSMHVVQHIVYNGNR